jgi:uncharacterized protein (DUF1810 family)
MEVDPSACGRVGGIALTDTDALTRFLSAQNGGVYDAALAEIRSGRKRTHWMWFVFPQIDGLGSSTTSRHFAIRSADEAKAYLAHPVLGPRLLECMRAALDARGGSATDIFGSPDDMKLRSCATLFAAVSEPASVFEQVLARFFDGQPDSRTEELLQRKDPS